MAPWCHVSEAGSQRQGTLRKQEERTGLLPSSSVFAPVGPVFLSSLVSTRFLLPLTSLQLSDDESDFEISSLEDLRQDLDQREKPRPLSRSQLPETFGSSAWSPRRPRVPGW